MVMKVENLEKRREDMKKALLVGMVVVAFAAATVARMIEISKTEKEHEKVSSRIYLLSSCSAVYLETSCIMFSEPLFLAVEDAEERVVVIIQAIKKVEGVSLHYSLVGYEVSRPYFYEGSRVIDVASIPEDEREGITRALAGVGLRVDGPINFW